MSQSDKTSIVAVASVLGATMIAICLTKTVMNASSAKRQAQSNTPPTFVRPPHGVKATAPSFDVMQNQIADEPSPYIPPLFISLHEWSIQNAGTPHSCIVINCDCPKGDIMFSTIDNDSHWHSLPEYPQSIQFNNSGPHILSHDENGLIFVDTQGRQHNVLGLDIDPLI